MQDTPKKLAILQAGQTLLLHHGIRKVRIEEICQDARVSKRTFYKYFHDKDELAIAVLGKLFEENQARLKAIFHLDCSIEEKAQRIMALKSELASKTSATFYREAMDNSTAPGAYALQEQRKWDQWIRQFYAEAQARGEIRGDIDTDVLIGILVRCRDLVKDPGLLGLVPDFMHLVETIMKIIFYGVVPRPADNQRGIAGKAWREKA